MRELTPPGRGGVSVLSVSGADARERVGRLLAGGPPPVGPPRLVRLVAGGELLDEAILLVHSPERVELHVHGSPPLVRRLLEELGGEGAIGGPPARVEDRALELAARAGGEAAARMLLDQARGALRAELDRLTLVDPPALREGVDRLVARARVGCLLARPPRVVLAGPTNAGKSTLFNVLVGRQRVVTSGERATTRDAIEERVLLGAIEAVVVDTAGEGPPAGESPRAEVERLGQELAREARGEADLVLWLDPGGGPPPPGTVPVTSQADRLPPARRARAVHPIAARDEPEHAQGVVEGLVREALDLSDEPWTPGRVVHFTPDIAEGIRALGQTVPTSERRRALLRLLGPSSA